MSSACSPGDHVLIYRVDKSAVQVEQQRGLRDLDIEAVLHGSWLPLSTGGELAAAISCRLEQREHRRPHPWFSISRIALNGGAGANDITAFRPGVVVALQVIRGPRERVGDPLVDYQHRPDVGEYRRHRGSGCSDRTRGRSQG